MLLPCGISSSGTSLRALPVLYQQALEALDYNVVIQDESYTYYNDILPLQKDAPLQMNWNMVTGAKGAVKIKNRTYKDNTYNDVDRFYPSDASYYTTKQMPEIVQQLQTQQQGYQAAPQNNWNQQTSQQQGYQAGQF